MGEPKTFASLSSGLLARKGAARPAMRPQGFGQVGQGLDDLGWNDMGDAPEGPSLASVESIDGLAPFEPQSRKPLNGLTPATSPVHEQRASIVGRLSAASAEDFADENEDEEFDETAELYDPEGEDMLDLSADMEAEDEDEEEAGEIESPMPFAAPAAPVAETAKPRKQPMFTADSPPTPVDGVVAALLAAQAGAAPAAPVVAEPVVAEPVAEAPSAPMVDDVAPRPEVAQSIPAAVAEVAPSAPRAPRERSAPGSKGKAAFTLRLDKARHLKLRLACAVRGVSAQQIVTDALDAYLATLPDLDRMADTASRQGE